VKQKRVPPSTRKKPTRNTPLDCIYLVLSSASLWRTCTALRKRHVHESCRKYNAFRFLSSNVPASAHTPTARCGVSRTATPFPPPTGAGREKFLKLVPWTQNRAGRDRPSAEMSGPRSPEQIEKTAVAAAANRCVRIRQSARSSVRPIFEFFLVPSDEIVVARSRDVMAPEAGR